MMIVVVAAVIASTVWFTTRHDDTPSPQPASATTSTAAASPPAVTPDPPSGTAQPPAGTAPPSTTPTAKSPLVAIPDVPKDVVNVMEVYVDASENAMSIRRADARAWIGDVSKITTRAWQATLRQQAAGMPGWEWDMFHQNRWHVSVSGLVCTWRADTYAPKATSNAVECTYQVALIGPDGPVAQKDWPVGWATTKTMVALVGAGPLIASAGDAGMGG